MRREVKSKNLKRRGPSREPYDKVLIVCEGKKTEPNYLRGLKNALRLNSTNVAIAGIGVTPTSIVSFAKKRYREERKTGDPFDKVFCVFDKDQHTGYDEAIENIHTLRPKATFMAITSIPAFEYWLLLHHIYSDRPCNSKQVLGRLKKYMPDYKKGHTGIFDQLRGNLQDAKRNARQSWDSAINNETDNPTTQVYELVEFLEELKQR